MSKTDDALAALLTAVDELSELNRLLADRQPQARGTSHPRFDFRTEREDAARTWGESTNRRTQEHAEAIGAGPDQKMLAALDRLRTRFASLPADAAFASLRSRADRVFKARAYQPVTLSAAESIDFARKLGRANEPLAVLLCPRPIDARIIAELRADILAAIATTTRSKRATPNDTVPILVACKYASRSTLYRMVKQKRLTEYWAGKRRRFSVAELEREFRRKKT